jgi:hypothetical protein
VFPCFVFHVENFKDLRSIDFENCKVNFNSTIPIAVQSRVQVCGRLIAEIAGSNPAEVMDVRLLCLLCVV